MILLITLACILMAISIGAFYCIVYKEKENMILATLAASHYLLYVYIIGFLCFKFENVIDYVFDYDFSEQFKILFILFKVAFFVLIPAPVLSVFIRLRKWKRTQKNANLTDQQKNE